MAKNLKSVIFLLRTILLAHKCTLTLTSDFWRQGLPTISRNSHGHKLCSSIGFLIFIFIKNFFQKFVQEKYKTLAVAFKSTFKYIDDVYLLTTEYQ